MAQPFGMAPVDYRARGKEAIPQRATRPDLVVQGDVEYQIDPESAAFKIFNQLFYVIMPVMQVRSIEEIRERGVVISGDKAYDAAMKAERRFYYQTIAQLVDHHRNAVAIRLVYPKDAVAIYRLVQDHLEHWADRMKRAFNVRADQELIDDLLAMEAFAQAVYPKAQENSEKTAHFDTFAQGFLGVQKAKSGLGLTLPSRQHLNVQAAPAVEPSAPRPDDPFAHLRNRQPVTAQGRPTAPSIPPRPSLEGVFKQRKIQHDPIFDRPAGQGTGLNRPGQGQFQREEDV